MDIFVGMSQGGSLPLLRSNPKHLGGSHRAEWPIPTGSPEGRTRVGGLDVQSVGASATSSEAPDVGFDKLMSQALGRVNDMQIETQRLSRQMITDPDSVNIHDITIAMAEANLSLSMTNAIVDRAIKAYREIISTR